MSRGRPPGDYGPRSHDPRSPGHDPASDRWQDEDSWMSEDTDGNGGGPAWPYSQQGLGRSGDRSGDRGAGDGRGSGTSVTGDWQTWQSQPQRKAPDAWAAGQEFSAPWSKAELTRDDLGSSRSSGSGRWTPGAAAAPGTAGRPDSGQRRDAAERSGAVDYYSDL